MQGFDGEVEHHVYIKRQIWPCDFNVFDKNEKRHSLHTFIMKV